MGENLIPTSLVSLSIVNCDHGLITQFDLSFSVNRK